MSPWDGGGVFSRTDGTRDGSDVWDQARQADADINSADHDTHDQDLADGLNNALTKDGQNSPSAHLPMDGQKHTGVGEATDRTDYATFGQLLDTAFPFVPAAGVGGTGDAIALTPAVPITGYVVGRGFRFFVRNANAGSPTLAVSGRPALTVRGSTGHDLAAGDLGVGRLVTVVYNGADWWSDVDRPRQKRWTGTQAEYNALGAYDPDTLYLITG